MKLKIAILSRGPKLYSTKRLIEAARARGHTCRVLDPLKFTLLSESHKPELFYGDQAIGHYDVVLPRVGASITFYGLSVLRQFEQMGVHCENGSLAIARSRDKLRSIQILSRYDIGITPTAFVKSRKDVLPAIQRVGGAPVIIKVLEGTQGIGVILAETEKAAEAIIETLHGARQNVLIQKFVSESKGKDIRAFVVGDRVVAAMRRTAQGDEYRSNVHRGGKTEAIKQLPPEFEYTAVRAAQILGLRVAGVDMLESEDGPQVMEVNSSPGLEGIEKVTGINVADEIIADIEQQVLFPSFDLKQRLRLSGGYGIAEFQVHKMKDVQNKALRDTNFPDLNIHVMSITRDNEVIANPRGDEVILEGDSLLCYGELSQLRTLVPARKGKKKRKTIFNANSPG